MQLFTQFKITNYGVVTAEKFAKQIIILAKSLRRFEVAIAVNQDLMEQEIRQKNRKHYAIAARYLKDIKQCYLDLDHLQDWQHYQAEFNQKYMKLRALMDECRYSLQA